MVTKALILRPVDATTSGTTVYPEDTPLSQHYLLVAEEEADNDSTYITLPSSLPSLAFSFTLTNYPEIMSNTNLVPIHLKIYATAHSVGGENLCCYVQYPSATSITQISAIALMNDSGYNLYEFEIPEDKISEVYYNYLCVPDLTNGLVRFSYTTPNGAKSSDSSECRLTQTYIEVTYQVLNAIEGLYEKKDNEWTPLIGKIYRKINNEWQLETDTTFLQNDTKYTINNEL